MQQKPFELLIATNNQGKVKEIAQLFGSLPVKLMSLADFDNIIEVEETGLTFNENAILKARGYAIQTGMTALADDSGLEIDALNNAPGVLSARYAGENTGFGEKMRLLLSEMEMAADDSRAARFVCSMAVSNSEGVILHSVEATCGGKIAFEPRGNGGFGYDPIFQPKGFDMTFGELPDAIKREISHRARASALIMRFLLDFIVV
ncbi:MAG: RdgB/HAM1 family non-canonical purine NTP pyrophosphatase [Pyrinomonadaceae bacterium]